MRPPFIVIALLLAGSAVTTAAGPPRPAASTIRIRIENRYVAVLNLGILGKGQRNGTDIVDGTLTLQPNGSWEGEAEASVDLTHMLKGLGQDCPETRSRGKQRMRVTATPVPGFARNQAITYGSGTADGGHLALVFEPTEAPRFDPPGKGPCLDLYQRGAFEFLPLNDTRWTEAKEGSELVIGLPARGVLEYEDLTLADFDGPEDRSGSPLPGKGTSKWKIRIERQ
jgi:hypothetical protein